MNAAECVKATMIASIGAASVNLAARQQGLAKGGYAFHGVCNDSTALIETAIRGKTTLFPLTAHGDAKAGVVALIRKQLIPHLKGILCNATVKTESTLEFNNIATRNPGIRDQVEQILNGMDLVAKIKCELPDDHTISPNKIEDSITRFISSVHDEIPFEYVRTLKESLPKLKDEWKEIVDG